MFRIPSNYQCSGKLCHLANLYRRNRVFTERTAFRRHCSTALVIVSQLSCASFRKDIHILRQRSQQRLDYRLSTYALMQPAAVEEEVSVKFVLTRNEDSSECELPSELWLRSTPRGAYTTARTVGLDSVLELSFHITRLAQSAALMISADDKKGLGCGLSAQQQQGLTTADLLRPKVANALRAAVHSFRAMNHTYAQVELKLTMLVSWEGAIGSDGFDVWVHVAPLPDTPQPPIKVQVAGAPRSNALAKDSEWVRARQQLQDNKPKDVNEVLLVSSDGCIFEGMSSNFYTIEDGSVVTAGEGILLGTVREVVLQVCEQQGIPVVLRPPRMCDMDAWEAAFITSTSRLVLPVDHISVVEGAHVGTGHSRVLPRNATLMRLRDAVQQELSSRSEKVV